MKSFILPIVTLLMLLVCVIAVAFGFGKALANAKWETELIKKGLAEYYLDEEHHKQFRLLIDKESDKP